jgi:hypothetical protein
MPEISLTELIKKIKSIMHFVGDGEPESKIYKLVRKYKFSDEIIDKLPFITAAYMTIHFSYSS